MQSPCLLALRSLNTAYLQYAGLAQLVEHLICNQGVAGSNPAAGTILINHFSGNRSGSQIRWDAIGIGSYGYGGIVDICSNSNSSQFERVLVAN